MFFLPFFSLLLYLFLYVSPVKLIMCNRWNLLKFEFEYREWVTRGGEIADQGPCLNGPIWTSTLSATWDQLYWLRWSRDTRGILGPLMTKRRPLRPSHSLVFRKNSLLSATNLFSNDPFPLLPYRKTSNAILLNFVITKFRTSKSLRVTSLTQ